MLQSPNAIVLKSIKQLSRVKIPKRTQNKTIQRDQLQQILHMFSNKSKFNMEMDYSFDRSRSKTEQSQIHHKQSNNNKVLPMFKVQADLNCSNAVQKIVQANSVEFTLLGHKSKSLHFKNYLQLKETFAQKKARLLSINIPDNDKPTKFECLDSLSNLKVNTALFLKKIQKNSPKKLLESKLRRFAIELSPLSGANKYKQSSACDQQNQSYKYVKKLQPSFDEPIQRSKSNFKQRLLKMEQINKNIAVNLQKQKIKKTKQYKGGQSKADLTPWPIYEDHQDNL